ncbi:Flp pilus assembly protein CpaB [bacterium]|nr:MAG: Flp pilus assembly protein CpaB [bacterium]
MNTRRTTLLIALVLAVGTGLLTLNYVRSVQQSAGGASQSRAVMVAVQNIPARAPITAAMVRREMRPASAVDPDAVAEESQAVGALALITIPAGSTLTASKIGRPANAALPVRLTPGMRALTIAVDRVKDVAGMIQPGDRVDVIAIPPRSGNPPPAAATILRGLRVLAIGAQLEYPSATPAPSEESSTTVTLEVTPKQADLLAMADVNTTLRLSLRSPREPVASLDTEPLQFAVAQAPSAATVAAAPAARAADPKPAAARPRVRPGVTIIDGDRVTFSTASASGGVAQP